MQPNPALERTPIGVAPLAGSSAAPLNAVVGRQTHKCEDTKMPWNELRADTHRQYGQFTWGHVIKGVMTCRTFRVVVTMRLCQAVAAQKHLRFLLFPLRVVHRWATHRAAMDLPWETEIGAGIALTHGWGLVISRGAKIGSNVTLFHGVTIGRRDRISSHGTRHTEYPVIEDEVWVGPHAIIVGGVTVGHGSRIAGGAFVVSNVPAYSVVSGNPSSIAKTNCTPDVMNRASLRS